MAGGVEMKLYDPLRDPAQWTEVLGPTQCAVFLKDALTAAPFSPAGDPLVDGQDATCLVFDNIDPAQQFCEALVTSRPHVCCEIFDREGLAHPPLVVILHPSRRRHDQSGALWAKRRGAIAAVLLCGALPLIWVDWKNGWSSFLPTFFAINMIVAGLRFVYWDFGLRQRERERIKRLEAHRRRELG